MTSGDSQRKAMRRKYRQSVGRIVSKKGIYQTEMRVVRKVTPGETCLKDGFGRKNSRVKLFDTRQGKLCSEKTEKPKRQQMYI